jgi:hypothetical protein
LAETRRLISQTPSGEYVLSPCINQGSENDSLSKELKAAKWRLAIDVTMSATARAVVDHRSSANRQSITSTSPFTPHKDGQQPELVMESRHHVIERIPAEGRGNPTQFIPIRFFLQNKVKTEERMLLAFDAVVLS